MIKRYLLVLVCLFCCGQMVHAQQIVQAWGGGADQNDLSFGFSFQSVNTELKIVKRPDWRSPFYDPETGALLTDSLSSISSKSSPGFAIGFITRYRLTDHIEVRTTPSLVFSDRSLSFRYATTTANPATLGTNVVEKQIQTTAVDVPLLLKIKSDRLGNFRAYMIGGIKYTKQITNKKPEVNQSPIDKLVRNRSSYLSYEAGIGFDFYFEFFKFSPEIKLSNSITNMLVPENHPYSRPLDKLFLRTLSFSLYFE